MYFLRNVNTVLMLACAWNEWTCVSDTLVIMNFADISKKGNKFHKVSTKNDDKKMFPSFLNNGILERIGDHC